MKKEPVKSAEDAAVEHIETKVGSLIRVNSKHWARAKQIGTLMEWQEDSCRWLVKFDRKGIGFDEGHYMYMDDKEFEVIK